MKSMLAIDSIRDVLFFDSFQQMCAFPEVIAKVVTASAATCEESCFILQPLTKQAPKDAWEHFNCLFLVVSTIGSSDSEHSPPQDTEIHEKCYQAII
jgi:hypothetical protein